ncbi:MAG: YggT family protein [Clostridia bacterium]|nr:YggT family protein [Clostridia bacterium]
MGIIFYLLNTILYLFDICLLVRAVCSWIPSCRDLTVYRISYTVTEPILRPIRDMLFRIDWIRRCPLDLSFLVVILIVNVLSGATSYLAIRFS